MTNAAVLQAREAREAREARQTQVAVAGIKDLMSLVPASGALQGKKGKETAKEAEKEKHKRYPDKDNKKVLCAATEYGGRLSKEFKELIDLLSKLAMRRDEARAMPLKRWDRTWLRQFKII